MLEIGYLPGAIACWLFPGLGPRKVPVVRNLLPTFPVFHAHLSDRA